MGKVRGGRGRERSKGCTRSLIQGRVCVAKPLAASWLLGVSLTALYYQHASKQLQGEMGLHRCLFRQTDLGLAAPDLSLNTHSEEFKVEILDGHLAFFRVDCSFVVLSACRSLSARNADNLNVHETSRFHFTMTKSVKTNLSGI